MRIDPLYLQETATGPLYLRERVGVRGFSDSPFSVSPFLPFSLFSLFTPFPLSPLHPLLLNSARKKLVDNAYRNK
jgi:hypothetical protein